MLASPELFDDSDLLTYADLPLQSIYIFCAILQPEKLSVFCWIFDLNDRFNEDVFRKLYCLNKTGIVIT